MSYLLAAVFAAVIGLQSVIFNYAARRMMTELNADRRLVVPREEMAWISSSPLSHWATSSYAMVLQGKEPKKLLLDPEADPRWLFSDPPLIPLAYFVLLDPLPGPAGWYDHRPLIDAIHSAYRRPARVPKTGDPLKPRWRCRRTFSRPGDGGWRPAVTGGARAPRATGRPAGYSAAAARDRMGP